MNEFVYHPDGDRTLDCWIITWDDKPILAGEDAALGERIVHLLNTYGLVDIPEFVE